MLIRAPNELFAPSLAPTKRATKYRVVKCQMCKCMFMLKFRSLLYEPAAAFHCLGPNHLPIFKIHIRIGDGIGPLPHSKGEGKTY